MLTYAEKLRDPRWQRCRLEIFKRDNFCCLHCGSSSRTLHVHHRYYVKDRDPWNYPNFSLITLCDECHAAESNYGGLAKWEIAIEQLQDDPVRFFFLRALVAEIITAKVAGKSSAAILHAIHALVPERDPALDPF